MNNPYSSHVDHDWNDDDLSDADLPDGTWRKPNRERRGGTRRATREKAPRRREPRRQRVEASDGTFRCRNCKTMVGPPVSGGRHRNHCPLCLYSRHVDRSRPGDRLSDCRSMMQPTGLLTRRDGEQMLVHECLGCGTVRRNRIAADDNTVTAMRLPVLGDPAASSVDTAVDRSVS